MLDAQESADQVGFSLPARPRYAPIIAPPPEIQKLEPAWEACKSQFAFDPPRSLVPASALVPSPTPANQAGPQLAPAMPSPSIEDPPAQTESGNPPAAVGSSSSGDPPPNIPDTVDPPNTKGPNTEGKQGNAAEPDSPNNNTPATDGKHGNAADSDWPNNKAPAKDGKQGNAPEAGNLNADPPSQPEAGQNDPEKPNALPDFGSDGIIRPVPNPSVLEIGRQTFTALSSGGFAVADTTLQANGPAVTIQGVSVSLDKSSIVVGSSTLALPAGSGNGVLTAAGQTFTPLGGGSILLNGNTLSVNGPPATASGTILSLASSGLVVDSQIFALPTPALEVMHNTKNTITFAGETFTQLGSDAVAFHGTTLVANGAVATISGTVISLTSSNLVVGSQTFALPTPAPKLMSNANKIMTFAGQTFTQFGSDAVAFHGTTLVANGPAATISGTVISLASSNLVVGSKTFALPTPAPNAFPSAVVIDGTTLTAGASAVTISGNTLSLAFGSSGLYVAGHGSGSSTFSVPMTAGESALMDAEGHLVVVDGSGDVGGLGSAIMLGFGPPNEAGTASATGKRIGTTPGNSSNATTGILGFTGKGSRCSNLHAMAAFGLAFYISLAILQ